jgi:peptidoglycan hydrolase-like protein with peptidoglycan-binding domain
MQGIVASTSDSARNPAFLTLGGVAGRQRTERAACLPPCALRLADEVVCETIRMGVDKNRPGKFMMSLTNSGKTALAAALAAMMGCGAALAGDRDDNWWLNRKNEQSTNSNFGIISNIAGNKGGKAVTKTEVFVGKSVLPMVSPSSDQAMTDAVARYEIVVSRGGWPEVGGSKLARGGSGPDVVKLRQRLALEGYLPSDGLAGENPQDYSAGVMKAVAQFQANHGLAVTGKVDGPTANAMNVSAAERLATLKANVPRMREYSKGLGPRYIIVNVPALQLEAVNFNTVFSRHNVIAGQPSRPTPVTLTQVSDVNFNPYWNAPVSIVEKDIIPRVQREGTRVLRDMNMRIYDGYNGPEVNPDDVDWDNVPPDRFFFRQDPGEENAMASVKINFPSPFGIYLHDTPTKNLFTAGARYLSSGCVRVEQVHVLVNWILNGQDGWNPARIEQMASSSGSLDVKVNDAPQLRTVYLTAWATANGQVNFRDDIYDLDRTGFIVGQPMPPGEYSDDGQRFVLKPVARQASASADSVEYFKPGRKGSGFSLFSSFRSPPSDSRPSDSSKLLLGRRDNDQMSVVTNFSSQPEPTRKVLLKKSKQLADSSSKTAQKKRLLQASRPADKTVEKASKIAGLKKKPEPAVASMPAVKKKPAKVATVSTDTKKSTDTANSATTVVKKKKKKVEEASATAASPVPQPAAKPIFTQQ